MFDFFAYTFGYVLNFIYNIVGNYGWAIILFTIVVKLLLLPISIKQQRTMKKSAKLQEQVKALQFKYKNDPQKMNQEMMNLYKAEHMSPFSGCLSAIVQIILLLSVFYLVRSPLKFMKHVPKETIDAYTQEIRDGANTQNNEQTENKETSQNVEQTQAVEVVPSGEQTENIEPVENAEVAPSMEQTESTEVVQLAEQPVTTEIVENKENSEENKENKPAVTNSAYPEIDIIRLKGQENPEVYINMDFLGLDLSQIPNQNMADFRVYIIPVLYIISSIISMRITTSMQKKMNAKKKEEVIDITENNTEGEEGQNTAEVEKNDVDVAAQTSKTMSWLIPIMAISIAFVAPLGLALYWLVNNISMIIERVALNKLLKDDE